MCILFAFKEHAILCCCLQSTFLFFSVFLFFHSTTNSVYSHRLLYTFQINNHFFVCVTLCAVSESNKYIKQHSSNNNNKLINTIKELKNCQREDLIRKVINLNTSCNDLSPPITNPYSSIKKKTLLIVFWINYKIFS